MNPGIRIEKLNYALKHLGKAAQNVKERDISKKDLTKKLQKVKASAKKGKDVSSELEEIEETLRQVMKNEREMLEQQKRYVDLLKTKLEQVSPDFKDEFEKMKTQLDRNMASENLHAAEYKNRIEQLEFGLSHVEKEELYDLRYTKEQVNRANRGISDIRQRLDVVSPARLNLLEKRIRSDVQMNRKQLLLIEQEIRHLERKSKELKKKGIPKEVLGKVEEKISSLKNKSEILMKKYPPSTGFVPRKLNLNLPEKKPEWVPPNFKDIKKEVKEKKQEAVSELKIPSLKKVPEFSPKKLPPKPTNKQLNMPALEGEGKSVVSSLPKLENDFVKQEKGLELPKVENHLPDLQPDLDNKFEMPKEFGAPKQLSLMTRIRAWFGL
ncbi:MAG: hypothetical protein U9R08_06200 [Nanoarchaeota archaeon]|nr:hypothetical protein [Nanoarchaeota archaeon]